jgi:hypothetical protein
MTTTALQIVQQDPEDAESVFLAAVDVTLGTELHVAFPAPSNILTGTQTFRWRVRKTAGSPTPHLDMWLYEDGVMVRKLLDDVLVESTTGEIVQGTWAANEVTDPASVECRIVTTPGVE